MNLSQNIQLIEKVTMLNFKFLKTLNDHLDFKKTLQSMQLKSKIFKFFDC